MPDYDDYTIIRKRFGAGGSGYIHKAKDPNGRIVALKVPNIAFSEDTIDLSVVKAYQNEAATWQKLCVRGIPGIVELYEHGVFNGLPWIAMEFMEGGDLKRRAEALSFEEKLTVVRTLLLTFSEVHRLGVIHRDIKPENILFTKSGEPKVSDWGLGKVLLTAKTQTVNPKMSIHYAAPEQFSKKIKVDGKTDIYQFGAMCYELLTGQYVFPGDDLMEAVSDIMHDKPQAPSELNPDIPDHVNRIVLKCLEKKKENRYRSMDIVLYKLENAGEAGFTKKVKKVTKPTTPVSTSKDRCSNCKNLIATTNKLLRCSGCRELFCDTCEGWFRAERKRGEKPLCETCYGKEMKRQEEEERRRKALEEKRRREEEQRRKALAEQRKRELEEKKRKELEAFLTAETTTQNAVKKQQAWARKQGVDVTFTGQAGIEFVLIPAGTFIMGGETGYDDSKPPHQVTLSKPFYLGTYQVTQSQWKTIMGKNPSKFTGDTRPVEQVSWNDGQEYVRKLNSREGVNMYRLPTEAEWEYACRAGTGARFCFGDDEARLEEYAWFDDNSKGETHPVGQKKPNLWGLYDMHGNVWEWCQDWFAESYYKVSPDKDPQGAKNGSFRVFRGGGWFDNAGGCASAYRYRDAPGGRFNYLGFRLARSL